MRALVGLTLLPLLAAAPSSAAAQVAADVVVAGGPVAGRVVIGRPYPPPVYVAPRVVYAERHAPEVIVVERRAHRHPRGHAHGYWRKHGFRPVVVYEARGVYYDRWYRGIPGLHEVVVYERDGRYYRDWDYPPSYYSTYDGGRRYYVDGDHDGDRYDRDRYRERDRYDND